MTQAIINKSRHFRDDAFWKEIPGWAQISEEQFADHKWQAQHSVRSLQHVKDLLGGRVPHSFYEDVEQGLKITPMNIRISPYIFSLIDWNNPEKDPLRKQFLPIASQFIQDHPYDTNDSLNEDTDSPVPMLTHRYEDKVLFLPLTLCPVYCTYCTRSRIIGGTTETKEKHTYGANAKKWDQVFDYIRQHPEVEDVVISGGDSYNLTAKQVRIIGEQLLNIPHIRKIRYATKGIAVLPMKVLTDDAWYNAILDMVKLGRSMNKQVCIHTHFSSPNEITKWSQLAMERLFQDGVVVRNQAVLQQGVNNSIDTLSLLIKQLSYMNIQPYYIYMHDMVPGVEHLRTTLADGIKLEKELRGVTAGFNTPTVVCDLPGGGGKRHVSSFEYYDQENGISVWTAPSVKPGKVFTYFDPIHRLSQEARKRWANPMTRKIMVNQAIEKSDFKLSA